MREHHEPRALGPACGLVIGAFDGLHLGHQALLARAAAGLERLALVTFDPHPAEVLVPERAPPRLQSARQRARVCRALGVDDLVILPFDQVVAATSPAEFVQRYLIDGLAPGRVVVGDDFRYGKAAAGDVQALGAQLREAGIEFHALKQVNDARGRKLGSSAVRDHVIAGEMGEAAEILGYLYPVSGEVVHGAARGRTLGFRTANVQAQCLPPATGVYAGWARAHGPSSMANPGESPVWPAVANVGFNPTFTGAAPASLSVEVHILDQELGESLYGQELEFSFVQRLRDEQRFDGPAALTAAITRDASAGRELLAQLDPSACRPKAIVRTA